MEETLLAECRTAYRTWGQSKCEGGGHCPAGSSQSAVRRHRSAKLPRREDMWSVSLLAVLFCLLGFNPVHAEQRCFDVALVLSIDASMSISDEEYRLQILGIASALRSPEVLDALDQAGDVAMAAVVWSSTGIQKSETDWSIITSVEAADLFAMNLEGLPRPMLGDTGLASGLLAALEKYLSLKLCSLRKVINVSGDGEETLAARRPAHRQCLIR
jgi:hypothetical protein